MNKVIRDGLVAVLYSPGYGAGWSTWSGYEEFALFCPEIVELVEQGRKDLIPKRVEELLPGKYFCTLGAAQLVIAWLPVGTLFKINEYDGSESIETNSDGYWHTA